jgi:hypothetical protein
MDHILQSAGFATVLTGVQVPPMNAAMERWVKTLRAELLDRALISAQAQAQAQDQTWRPCGSSIARTQGVRA